MQRSATCCGQAVALDLPARAPGGGWDLESCWGVCVGRWEGLRTALHRGCVDSRRDA